MDDEKHEKQMMRNQMIAMVLLAIMMMVFFKWFAPPPQMPAQGTEQPGATTATGANGPAAADTPQKSGAASPIPAKPAAATLPGLPEIPTIADPTAEEVTLSGNGLELVFTKIGARLKRAKVVIGQDGQNLVPQEDGVQDTEAYYPLGLHFTDPKLGESLDHRRFEVEKDASGSALTFSLTIPDTCVIRKRFGFDGRERVLTVSVDYQNISQQPAVLGVDQTPAYYLNWAPNVTSGDELLGLKQAFVWLKNGLVEEMPTASLEASGDGQAFVKEVPETEWAAVKSAYFVVALKPENTEKAQAWVTGDPQRFAFGLGVPRFEVAPGAVQTSTFALYMGPSESRMLAKGWKTLPSIFRFFQPPWTFMDVFAKFLLKVLNAFYAVIPNYGLGIIFLTILVRLGMYPLTLKSMKSMKKMQLLGPELEALKAKHADDPQAMNQKMMELYRERGVNPMGGCLPMLLQMPVFIALYRMLWCSFELRGAPFFGWITDLSAPENMFHIPWLKGIPLLGDFQYFNLLPILMGVAMVISQKIMPQTASMPNQQQKIMMIFMPIFFSYICYTMPSGLNLYILTSTVLGMVQQKYTSVSDEELKAKKVVGKRQHFYTAAKARQRQRAREAKKERP